MPLPSPQPIADIRPVEAQVASDIHAGHRLAVVNCTAAALLVDPASFDLEARGQLVRGKNILGLHQNILLWRGTSFGWRFHGPGKLSQGFWPI
jgi:hypothetical protein